LVLQDDKLSYSAAAEEWVQARPQLAKQVLQQLCTLAAERPPGDGTAVLESIAQHVPELQQSSDVRAFAAHYRELWAQQRLAEQTELALALVLVLYAHDTGADR
jgi:hypothetical protein